MDLKIYLIFTFLLIKYFWLSTTKNNKFVFLYCLPKTYCSSPELLIVPFNAERQRKHSWNSQRKYTTRCCYENHYNTHDRDQNQNKKSLCCFMVLSIQNIRFMKRWLKYSYSQISCKYLDLIIVSWFFYELVIN